MQLTLVAAPSATGFEVLHRERQEFLLFAAYVQAIHSSSASPADHAQRAGTEGAAAGFAEVSGCAAVMSSAPPDAALHPINVSTTSHRLCISKSREAATSDSRVAMSNTPLCNMRCDPCVADIVA